MENELNCRSDLLGTSPNLPVKQRCYEEQKLEGKTVHVSTFMDLRHLKNSELENKFQKIESTSGIER